MAPKGFDKYFLVIGAGRNRKLVRLTDSERCAHFLGICSLAAQSPLRGYLLITEGEEVTAEEIANEAGGQVTVRVAESTMEKLKRVGVLERDDNLGAWFVHDWWEVNPDPRPDSSNADRQARYRARNASSNASGNGKVTAEVTPIEEEVEEEVLPNGSNARKARPTKRVDQTVAPENFPEPLLVVAEAVLPILHAVWDVRGGREPQLRGICLAIRRNELADHIQVARKLEHWLVAGNGTTFRCADIAARFGDWLEREPAAEKSAPGTNVVALKSSDKSDRQQRRLAALHRVAGSPAETPQEDAG
jgi:hypothetical protein